MKRCWVPHDTRDNLVDFVNAWADKTEIPVCRFLGWIGLGVMGASMAGHLLEAGYEMCLTTRAGSSRLPAGPPRTWPFGPA